MQRDCCPKKGSPRLTDRSQLRGLGVGLRSGALELERNEWLRARHPRVVPRLDHVRGTGNEILLAAVVVADMQAARCDGADMTSAAAVGTDDRLDRLRPPPTRLRRHAHRLGGTEVDDFD